ncbi:hypothetical protein CBS101457_004291 [Exobasidium rhododendri]|nr:hypothetical protein CBS101457_004291 [Exobasidium rhododendri]
MRVEEELQHVDNVKVASFLTWFERLGGSICPSFEFAQDDVMGLSVFACADMTPDIQAIAVPSACCITADHASRRILNLFERDKESEVSVLTGEEWIILYLMLHRVVNRGFPLVKRDDEQPSKRPRLEDSSLEACLLHSPYVSLLPGETLTPLHYTVEEIYSLKSTPLFGHAVERRHKSRRSCIKAVSWMLASIKEMQSDATWKSFLTTILQHPKRWGHDEQSWEVLKDWRWAETAYGSRAFPPRLLGEDNAANARIVAPILIPGLDAFNHSRQAKVTWTFNALPQQHITLTLHRSVCKGDQVFNSYGPKSNEDLLASYGFVNEGLEDDTITLKLGGTEHGQTHQQHYWRYEEPCPPALLEEVRSILLLAPDANSRVVETRVDRLEQEGEALCVIVDLLEQKCAAFKAAQVEIETASRTGETEAFRESVRRNVNVYRNS